MICTRPNCTGEVERYGLCRSHYRKACRAGQFNVYVDPEPAIERIANLRANRWTFVKIGQVAGIHHTIVADVYNRRQKHCTKGTFNAIMSIPPLSTVAVTPAGFRRRVQALAWMGWSQIDVARELGTTSKAMRQMMSTGQFSVRMGEDLAKVYKKLSLVEGPSRLSMLRARGDRGYAPPAAWDDDTIDTAPELSGGVFVNQPDGRKRKRTHCGRGHKLSGDNVAVMKSGERRCKACRRERERDWYHKRKAA